MNILEKIVATKREEVMLLKKLAPIASLQENPAFLAPCISISERLKLPGTTPVIAEFKRRSPSKGWIHENAEAATIAKGYSTGNAAAISVLTDADYFGGSVSDLLKAKTNAPQVPILRKDFTIDAYQLHEAKSIGADIILLIAAILSPAQVQELTDEAQSIGLQVLLELHDESELEHVCAAVDMVGINNRNLKNFEVNIEHSIRLQSMLPANMLRVAESGIHSVEVAAQLLNSGFNLLLMGEFFMKQPDPALAFAQFSKQLKENLSNNVSN
jgi:indole-3-glycerol phosphate synthase